MERTRNMLLLPRSDRWTTTSMDAALGTCSDLLGRNPQPDVQAQALYWSGKALAARVVELFLSFAGRQQRHRSEVVVGRVRRELEQLRRAARRRRRQASIVARLHGIIPIWIRG